MNLQRKDAGLRKSGTQKNAKGNTVIYAGIITYMLSLACRIPLSRVIGDTGVGMAAPAFELFTLCTLFFSYGISRTMTGLIRYRTKREQHRNAGKVFHIAVESALLFSLIFAAVLAVGSGYLCDVVVLEAMSKKAVIAAAPAVILSALVCVFRGYFNGNGFGRLVVQSMYIEKISMLVLAVLSGRFFFEYGKKAAALQQNDVVSYAYGALGMMCGVLLSQIIALLYLLLFYIIYSPTRKKGLASDTGRRLEGSAQLTAMLLGNAVPSAFVALLTNLFMLIDQRFFNYCMNRTENAASRAQVWGAYYGKFAVLTGIGAAIVCLSVNSQTGKIAAAYDRKEYHAMRDLIGSAVKKLSITAFPAAVCLAVLAEAFVTGFYKGTDPETVSLLRQGTVIIFFYGIAWLFGQLMLKMHMIKELLFSAAVSFALHFLLIYLLVRKALMGINGVVYSVIAFIVVLAALTFLLTGRKVGYRQEGLYTFAFPAVSACVAGLVAMLLNKLLLATVGGIVTVFISLTVGMVLYVLLLMILRVLNQAELEELPLGSFWIMVGRMIGIL